ncbi:MAG: type VI secretion system tip protein TssI/VgrG [Minicystis sp.]
MSTFELWFERGEKTLEVRQFSVHEAISELFTVSVLARSRLPGIDLEAIVGKRASLHVTAGTAHVHRLNARLWKGVCSAVEQVNALPPEQTGLSTYQLQIVPELWLLTQRRGHRIYQRLSIPDIVDALLGEWGIAPVWQIDRAAYPKLEYKVQHGESDYDFFSRLLEEVGIAFTFPDGEGSETKLTLGDKLHAAPPRPGLPIPFGDNANRSAQRELVEDVRLLHQVRPGAATFRDYDFRKPQYPLYGKSPSAPAPEDKYEQYHYDAGAFLVESPRGGDTPVADDKGVYRREEKHGTELATRVLASHRADKRTVAFNTNVIDLAPGVIFAVDGHPHPEIQSAKLLVAQRSVSGAPGEAFEMSGVAVFADPAAPYRPPRKTPKPHAHGMMSATVVGPPGEEIHVDEFGRVRVQFPWDREGRSDDFSSCWMRVSQGWAGTGYGMFMIPRVGQEVLVAFLDGDPDVPIVAGRVFNGKELVPYKLPDNKTVSTWKSSSSPGGGGYNEIKYEDKAGLELVYVQAQRDLHQLVKRDEVERTRRNKLSTVEGTEDVVVKGARRQLVESADHLHVKMDQRRSVDGTMSLVVKVDRQETVGKDYALDAGSEIHLKAGMTMVLESGVRLTLKSSGGFIDIHPGGIDIVGNVVRVNSGGEAGDGKGAHPEPPLDALEARPSDTSST